MSDGAEEIRKELRLIDLYRSVFESDPRTGYPSGDGLALYKDITNFCGLNMAKFSGDSTEIIKQMGRIEFLGRINYFLNYPSDKQEKLNHKLSILEGDGDE